MTDRLEAVREAHAHHFTNHKATVMVKTDDITVIDYKDKDGSCEYAVTFYIDHRDGTITISGDLGWCVASWGNAGLTVEHFANYMLNVGYFCEKIKCTSDRYEIDEEKLSKEVDEFFDVYADENDDYLDLVDSDKDFLKTLLREENEYNAPYSNGVLEIINRYDKYGDSLEWVSNFGRVAHTRILLWAIALNKAVEQLKERRLQVTSKELNHE